MERNVRVQNRVDAARPRRVLLRQCPHCGGDVPAETPHHHHVEERLAA